MKKQRKANCTPEQIVDGVTQSCIFFSYLFYLYWGTEDGKMRFVFKVKEEISTIYVTLRHCSDSWKAYDLQVLLIKVNSTIKNRFKIKYKENNDNRHNNQP